MGAHPVSLFLALPAAWVLSCATPPAAGADWVAHPDDHVRLTERLVPGDTLRLAPGEYRAGLFIHDLSGRADAPIIIEGPAAGPPAVFVAQPGRNTVSIADATHVVIRHLVLEGRGVPVDAVKCEGHARFAHHITLENLTIRGHGASQQTVGISTKCPAWNWVIRGNTIIGAGTGMYLGNSDGRAPFVAGLIEDNTVRDSIGYNLQIKHQLPRPDLPGMPTTPAETVIRGNRFLKTLPARADALPRPSVLVGHFPKSGPGAEDRYRIHHNLFQGNPMPGEALFQGEGNVVLYRNVFLAPEGDAIRIQPHNDIPKDVLIAYNTVLARGMGVSLRRAPGSEFYRQRVTHNVVFARPPLLGVAEGENLTGPPGAAAEFLRAPGFDFATADLSPRPGRLPRFSPLEEGLPELNADFRGRASDAGLPGALAE